MKFTLLNRLTYSNPRDLYNAHIREGRGQRVFLPYEDPNRGS